MLNPMLFFFCLDHHLDIRTRTYTRDAERDLNRKTFEAIATSPYKLFCLTAILQFLSMCVLQFYNQREIRVKKCVAKIRGDGNDSADDLQTTTVPRFSWCFQKSNVMHFGVADASSIGLLQDGSSRSQMFCLLQQLPSGPLLLLNKADSL